MAPTLKAKFWVRIHRRRQTIKQPRDVLRAA